jgi:hypothetical protein
MSQINTCGHCDAEWTGVGRCHHDKKGCHQTFGGVTTFDQHIRYGKCIHPSKLGLTQNEQGVWTADYVVEEEEDSSV